MRLQPRLNRPLLLALEVLLFLGLFGLCHFLLSLMFTEPNPMFSALLSLLIIIPNQERFLQFSQELIDRNFYRTLYLLKRQTESFNRDLNSILEYDQLIQRMAGFMDNRFGREHYVFFLFTGAGFERPFQRLRSGGENKPLVGPPITSFTGMEMGVYPVGEIMQDHPYLKPHIEGLGDQYRYFIPLKGQTYAAGFVLFDEAIVRSISVPETRSLLLHVFSKSADILENVRAHEAVKRKSLESALFLEIVRNITSTLEIDQVLQNLLDGAARLVKYDAAGIFLTEGEEKTLAQAVVRGFEELVSQNAEIRMNEGIIGQVISSGKSSLIPDVSDDPHYYQVRPETRAQLTVPIINQDEVLGAIVLESDREEAFTKTDLTLIEILSGLASIAIRNAQLYQDSQLKRQLESDLLIASRVQQALLPRRVPVVEGLRIDVFNLPSRIVGGDIYDVFRLSSEQQVVTIGDVSGKGAAAAILMAVAYAGFKSLMNEIDPVATTVARLNNFLCNATAHGFYLTFFYGLLDRRERRFTYCNAGHNAPYVLRNDGTIETLTTGGIVLGFLENQSFTQTSVELEVGEYVCMFTDGATEIRNAMEEEFGEERLAEVLSENYGNSPKEIRLAIVKALRRFSGCSSFDDDVTLLILRVV